MDKTNSRKINATAGKKIASNPQSWSYNTSERIEAKNRAIPRSREKNGAPSCPYCKSCLSTAPEVEIKSKKTSTASHGTLKRTHNREFNIERKIEPLTSGANPYAPHLKYGIFPKRNPPTNGKYNTTDRPKSPVKQRLAGIEKNGNEAVEDDYQCNSPFFSVRPLNEHDRGSFTKSQSTHLDSLNGNDRFSNVDVLKRLRA